QRTHRKIVHGADDTERWRAARQRANHADTFDRGRAKPAILCRYEEIWSFDRLQQSNSRIAGLLQLLEAERCELSIESGKELLHERAFTLHEAILLMLCRGLDARLSPAACTILHQSLRSVLSRASQRCRVRCAVRARREASRALPEWA